MFYFFGLFVLLFESREICEEGRHSELRSPFPLLALLPSGHAAVLLCDICKFIGLILYASVLGMTG